MATARQRLITIPYAPRPAFEQFHGRKQRWSVLVCHRRAGKTVAVLNDLLRDALSTDKPDWRGAYVAPYYAQAKDVSWQYIKRFAGVVPGASFNESELRCDLPNGSRLRLYGADGADVRMRGIYLDAVVLDEYADMHPELFPEVIRPLLSDRKGSAVFLGTPKGRNAFCRLYEAAQADSAWYSLMLRASETNIIDAEELAAAKAMMTPDQYAQEFECSFDAAIKGAYYAALIQAAEKDGRICNVPHDPILQTHTAWDLGVGDSTAIVMWQQDRSGALRIIDFYEAAGQDLAHYVNVLKAKPYTWGKHFLPHDAQARELGTGTSRVEVMQSLGVKPEVLPPARVEDGINAVRMMLPRAWIDKTKCGPLVDLLRQYREKRDEKRDISLGPLHDYTSHAADAVRYMAQGLTKAAGPEWAPLKYDFRGIV